MKIRPLLLALAVALAAAGGASGQLVMGEVVEAETGAPIAGAFVRLLGVDGAGRAAFLTGPDGRYQVQAPAAGEYTLQVERIGYEAVSVGPLQVEAPGVTRQTIRVNQQAIELAGLVVATEARRCSLEDGNAGSTQVVWSQVRTALDAASWTSRQRGLSFRIQQRQRRLSPGDGTVLDEERRTIPALGGNSVRSLPAAELAESGYVRTADDGSFEYFGPDAEVVLSPAFLDGHCFGLRRGEGETAGMIGLEFVPAGTPDRPDVSGVAWVDEASSRLVFLEFSYQGLPYEVGTELAGGEVHYEELPDGRWIVRDWFIRAPAIRVVQSDDRLQSRERAMVGEVYETGAEVVELRGRDFEWSQDLPVVELRGSVVDSTAAAPLAGAEVRIAGRGWRATTDARGAFSLSNLPPGRYRAVFDHPRLDSLGLPPQQRELELVAPETTVELALPSTWTLLARGCPEEGGTVVGVVQGSDGSRPPLVARIEARGPAGETLATATTTAAGEYRLCGLPAGPVTLRAGVGPLSSATAVVAVSGDVYAVGELVLDTRALMGTEIGRRIGGTVRDQSNGRPVTSATVDARDPDGAVLESTLTDSEGRFALSVDPDAAREVRVHIESLGYGTLVSEPIALDRPSYRLEVELSPEAYQVEGVVVSVAARSLVLDRVGFYQREERITGRFLEREELDLDRYTRVSDALMRVPGLQQVDMASQTGSTTERYLQFRGARAGGGRNACLPAIYVDGGIVRFPRLLGGSAIGQMDAGGDVRTLDDIIGAFDVEAIELYDGPSSGPPEFVQSSPPCGSIVIWTRR